MEVGRGLARQYEVVLVYPAFPSTVADAQPGVALSAHDDRHSARKGKSGLLAVYHNPEANFLGWLLRDDGLANPGFFVGTSASARSSRDSCRHHQHDEAMRL